MWFIGLLVGLPIVLVIAVPLGLYYAWAASILWGWFVVPVFHLPVLNMWQMYGIVLMLGVVRTRFDHHKDERPIDWSTVAMIPLVPLLALGIGWFVR